MIKYSNAIPSKHLKKHWQINVWVCWNQAARKNRRLQARRTKTTAIVFGPMTLWDLLPDVQQLDLITESEIEDGLPSKKLSVLAWV